MPRFIVPSPSSSPEILLSEDTLAPTDNPVVVVPFVASTNHGGPRYPSSSRVNMLYPTFPDVKLRKLPFFKVLATLMQPCSLNPSGQARYQEQKFSFYLNPTQNAEIGASYYNNHSTGRREYKRMIQLR